MILTFLAPFLKINNAVNFQITDATFVFGIFKYINFVPCSVVSVVSYQTISIEKLTKENMLCLHQHGQLALLNSMAKDTVS